MTSTDVYDLVTQDKQRDLKELLKSLSPLEAIVKLSLRYPEISIKSWLDIYDRVYERADEV